MINMKPENALHRANELIEVGQKQHALNTLFEVITSRRHRTWGINHEPLINKFLALCIDLKKSQLAKDGLYQYKAISQEVSVESLDVVITNFLRQGEEQCSKARQEASNVLADIDDLEVLQTPESLLLSAVSGESQQDRTDRDVLVPWLKFVWESYKNCLDLLKNNNLVERTYQKVARKCFAFCKTYNRRTEFRKLCDTLRTHFQQSLKYYQQKHSVNIHNPETQELHLTTRLVQLDTAIDMELWQEAIKAVEDINIVTKISRKLLAPKQLASYYQKLALVFWKSGNLTFHATTLLSLYVLHKEHKKNVTSHELNVLATKAFLSILSITSETPRTQIDDYFETGETVLEKQNRLTNLLSLQQLPTRASLIRDMLKHGVLNFVNPELKTMYECLEIEFNPLKLSKTMEECIHFIETLDQPEYSQYMSSLRDVTAIRLLQQISQVYQTIEINRFIQLAPPIDKRRLERLIVNAAKNNDVQVRIEHKLNVLTFGTDLNLYNTRSANERSFKTTAIQKMPNEQIRNQLISISNALNLSMEIINEKSNKERNDKLKRQIAEIYHREELAQRKEILRRSAIIERHKEEREKESKDKEQQQKIISRQIREEREKDDKVRIEAERQRQLEEAAAEREREDHRLKMQVAIDKLCKSELGRKIVDTIGPTEIYSYDPDSLTNIHIDAIKKEAQEKREKLRIQFKKVDYLIRAQQEMEIPLINTKSEAFLTDMRHIQEEAVRLAIERRKSFLCMKDEKDNFLELIRGERQKDFNKQMEEFNQRLQIAREKRLMELRKEHIEKRKQEFRKQKQLKKQQREEEEKRKIEAELKRQKNERDAERKREFDEQTRKQREREKAIDEKLEKQKLETEPPRSSTTNDRRSVHFHQGSDKTEKNWRTNLQSRSDANDNWRNRNDNQRPRDYDRRFDDSPSHRSGFNDPSYHRSGFDNSSRQKSRYGDDQRRFPSQQQQQQQQHSSPTSSERRTLQTSDGADSWTIVEKKRIRPEHERPTQQQQQQKLVEPWRPKPRTSEETRENVRTGPTSSNSSGRIENKSGWRMRERRRMNSWRSNENEDEDEQPSSVNRPRDDKQ